MLPGKEKAAAEPEIAQALSEITRRGLDFFRKKSPDVPCISGKIFGCKT